MTEVKENNRNIVIGDSIFTINLEPEKKANDTDIPNNEILQKNLKYIYNNSRSISTSGAFNTVFSFSRKHTCNESTKCTQALRTLI